MATNLPTLAEIEADPVSIAKLPLDMLEAIQRTAEDAANQAAFVKRAVTNIVADRMVNLVDAAYLNKGADTGIVHIAKDGMDVQVTRSKTVAWDQAKLAELAKRIAADGDDPAEYLKVTYAVSEAAYAAWPSMIRRLFEPARTVRPGNPTIKLVRLEDAV